ncbi:hypothetical protein JNM05_00425 [bacterium]|nr:hypothetical protein [bacterium]
MMSKSLIKGSLLGGLVLFVWSSLSWTVIPWHEATLSKFTSDEAISKAILDAAPEKGIYYLPSQGTEEELWKKMETGPVAFLAIRPGAQNLGMGPLMGIQFLIQLMTSFLLTWLLLQTRADLSYLKRVMFVAIAAFMAGVMVHLPNWNWWEFSNAYTAVNMIDLFVNGLFAGLVIAKVAPAQAS